MRDLHPSRRVYVTNHTEYHVKDGVCVAVRDLGTGRWLPHHAALGCRLDGGLLFNGAGGIEPHNDAQPGDVLCFAGRARGDSVLTSVLVEVVQPTQQDTLRRAGLV